jgi:signal transduction histidine kinase
LLVNDNPIQLDALGSLISLDGYLVLTADGATSAFGMLEQRRPDIIISDVVMPGVDGIELCRTVKSDPATAGIPILLISGLRYDDSSVAQGLDAGADDYLEIDAPPSLLRKKIERLVSHRRLEDQLLQSQKMEAVGRLAGGVAHDFNNLLTAIIGYSQLLLGGFDISDPRRESLEEIEKAGKRAAALTSQLLAFSRKQVLQMRLLDLNSVVSNMETMLRRLIGEDVELAVALRPGIGIVKADQGQLEQVIMNLAVNARDAMPQGGKMTIETAAASLDEEYAREHIGVQPGRYVMLAISDTGSGMDKATQARIFEPFFTTKERGKGTGLGLSTVYGIVNQSGGHIWVYSEPGRGTTFKIYLPLVEDGSRPARESAEPPRSGFGSETVLLAEDEEAVRKLTRGILEMHGYTVLEANSGPEALRAVQEYPGKIHLLLTDVVMPQMSGKSLSNSIGLLRPDIKVLYVSGYTDEAIIQHGVLDRSVAFLQKPFTPEGLTSKVREVLDQEG